MVVGHKIDFENGIKKIKYILYTVRTLLFLKNTVIYWIVYKIYLLLWVWKHKSNPISLFGKNKIEAQNGCNTHNYTIWYWQVLNIIILHKMSFLKSTILFSVILSLKVLLNISICLKHKIQVFNKFFRELNKKIKANLLAHLDSNSKIKLRLETRYCGS